MDDAGATRGPAGAALPPVSITTARVPLSDDLARRQRRYLLQMSTRVLCFVGGVLTWGRLPLVVPVVLMLAATALPYVAVLLANTGADRRETTLVPFDPRLLGSAGGTTVPPGSPSTPQAPGAGDAGRPTGAER